MSRILFCFFLVMMTTNVLNLSGQIVSPSADGLATTSYTNGSSNDDIFIFCGVGNNGALEVNVSAGTAPYTYQWYQYNVATHSWSTMVGQLSSSLMNLSSGGYAVEVKDNTGTSVLFDLVWVWNIDLNFNAQANLLGCSDVDLSVSIPNLNFTYYNPPPPMVLISSNTAITVCYTGVHDYVSDLGFYLRGPASCGSPLVSLAQNPGVNCNDGDDFSNLCFSSESNNDFDVCWEPTPLSGTFGLDFGSPIQWSALNSCNAGESDWSVLVFDCEDDDEGALSQASITFSNLPSVNGSPTTISYNSGIINEPINDGSCTAALASSFDVPADPSLTTPIVLSAAVSGNWSTTSSALITNVNAASTNATSALDGDQFSYTATVSIGSASCVFTDDVVFNNNGVPLALSYPLTLCEGSGSISPILSGSSGGQYTSSPVGLVMSNNGIIQTNSSIPGTYVVTYTKTSGGCTQSTSVGLTIQDIPGNLTTSPASICDGEAFNGDAQTAFQYEYFLNGVSQSAPSSLSAATSPVLSASDDWCVRGYEGPGIIIDGNLTDTYWGNPLSMGNSNLSSSFGVANHLDALFVSQYQNTIAFGIAGQLEAGSNNRLLVFLDTETGGFNQLSSWTNRSNAPYYSLENLSGSIQFDSDFEPDYVLAVNTGSNGDSYVDLYHMASNTNNYLGSSTNPDFCSYIPSGNAFNVNAGYEFQFDLAELNNPQGAISLFAMLVNNPGSAGITTTLSNQFLSSAADGESSYGAGMVNFNAANPNPVHYIIGSGNCYLENCLVINPNQNVSLPIIPDQCLNSPNPFVLNSTVNGVNGIWSPSTIDVSVAGSGLYSFTPDANAGCYADGTTVVDVVNPTTPIFNINDVYCQGESPDVLPSSDGVITGTWSPAAIVTNATAIAAPLTYSFTPSSNQCALDFSLSVTVNPTEDPAFSLVTSLCQNATAPTLPLVDDNGIQGSWTGAVNTAVLGNQSLTFTPVSDPAHACAVPSTLNFTITNGTPATFAPIGPFCETENPTLPSVSAEGFTGTWTPAVINMTNFSAAGQLFTFQPDPNQCANSGTLSVVVLDAVDATFNFATNYCQGDFPAELPSNSLNGFSGTWLPNVIETNVSGPSNYVFTPNAGSCSNVTTVGVTINPPIAPVFNLPLTVCENGTAPLLPANSSNGVAGSWSPAAVNTAITGIQNFVFTHNSNSCATDYNYAIDVLVNQTPTFNPIGPFCLNTTASVLPLISNEGIVGTWNPASINTATIGNSSYIFTPSAGLCASNQTVQVIIDNQITPTFTPITALCSTEVPPVLATTSNNGISGVWSPSSVDMTVVGVSTYNFTPNPNQCASNGGLDIDIIAPVNPLFSFTTTYCVGDATDVLPNISDDLISGVWSPSNIDVSSATLTNYSFTVDAGQCANDISVPVSINAPADAVFADLDLDFCLNEIAPILPISDDGGMSGTWSPVNIVTDISGNFVFSFTPEMGECGNPTNFAVVVNDPITSVISGLTSQYCLYDNSQNLPVQNDDLILGTWSPVVIATNMAGSTDYVFTPNAGSCYSNYTHTVETFDLPQINYVLSDPEITCNVPIVTITASGGVSYLWSDGSSADAFDVSDDLPVSVTVTDNNGCQNDATIVVPMDIQTNAQLVYSTTELNCQTTIIDLSVLGGESYSWSPNGEITNGIDVTIPATYTVDVVFDNGCSQSLSLDVTQDTISPIGVIQNLSGTDELTCNQTSIVLQASGGLSYQWINGGASSQQSYSLPGLAEVEVTAANFCLDTVSYQIFQDILTPIVTISPSHPEFDCFTSEISLTAGGNAIGYEWANGLGTNPMIDCNQAGLYSVTGTAANGCTTQETINLSVNRFYPDSNFTYSPSEIWDDNPTISLDGPDQPDISYYWSVNDGEVVYDLNNVTFDLPSFTPGDFEICMSAYYTDICQSEECQIVSIRESLQVYIPTSFTPGSDGINDGYRPVFSNDELLESYHMEIFNRWGEKVFETDNPNRGWDGSFMNTGYFVPDGCYALIVTYRSIYSDEKQIHRGQITFAR